ncbi:cation diffusion facilitator family transporter [Ramlibacter tataouinensis]|uniref:Candidate Co/Zn/Cd cation transporter n=1 Tax=Ramlibacter tataouinensis (strain ATCC BAA-407 / DSM 14655 / LMG 21543 / TTB310) TaxID=365046 RepID=F5XXI6_RAMTT|nr:cation diffusion facilitator family transporter [Ramlibacter tataouinensis]AEG91789.1 Candidate Co/Zn/Cd cation transporter [Ramlibacter tataouinensis TTB310]
MLAAARTPAPETLLRASVAVALATIALKTLAWWLTSSVGLLSDAMESLVNLAGALFGLLMVRIASQPADPEHPYGHHKAEYFSSGFEGLLILVAALAILWAAVGRLLAPRPLEQIGLGMALSVLSSALNGALAWAMLRSARAHRSMALEGGARHLLTDVWTSAGVLAGVALVAATGWGWLDPVIAVAVALNILREGARLVWKSAQGLMDQRVDSASLAAIEQTLEGLRRPGIRFDHVITRRSGRRRFLDMHMHVPGSWTLQRAAAQRARVEEGLRAAVPGLHATIQLLPTDVEAQLTGQDEDLDEGSAA